MACTDEGEEGMLLLVLLDADKRRGGSKVFSRGIIFSSSSRDITFISFQERRYLHLRDGRKTLPSYRGGKTFQPS